MTESFIDMVVQHAMEMQAYLREEQAKAGCYTCGDVAAVMVIKQLDFFTEEVTFYCLDHGPSTDSGVPVSAPHSASVRLHDVQDLRTDLSAPPG